MLSNHTNTKIPNEDLLIKLSSVFRFNHYRKLMNEKNYEQAIIENTAIPDAHIFLARELIAKQQYHEAYQILSKAMQQSPEDATILKERIKLVRTQEVFFRESTEFNLTVLLETVKRDEKRYSEMTASVKTFYDRYYAQQLEYSKVAAQYIPSLDHPAFFSHFIATRMSDKLVDLSVESVDYQAIDQVAVFEFENAVLRFPSDVVAWIGLAEHYTMKARYTEAKFILETINPIFKHPTGYFHLGDVCHSEYQDAARMQKKPLPVELLTTAKNSFLSAIALAKEQHFALFASLLDVMLRTINECDLPNTPQPQVVSRKKPGKSSKADEQLKAINACNAALKLDPVNLQLYQRRAKALKKMGAKDKAALDEKIIELIVHKVNQSVDSKKQLQQVIYADTAYAENAVNRVASSSSSPTNKAIKTLAKAMAMSSAYEDMQLKPNLANSQRYFDALALNDPMNGAKQLAQQGLVAYSKQDYDTAILKFSSALTKNPQLHLARFYRGMCGFEMGNLDEAKIDFVYVIAGSGFSLASLALAIIEFKTFKDAAIPHFYTGINKIKGPIEFFHPQELYDILCHIEKVTSKPLAEHKIDPQVEDTIFNEISTLYKSHDYSTLQTTIANYLQQYPFLSHLYYYRALCTSDAEAAAYSFSVAIATSHDLSVKALIQRAVLHLKIGSLQAAQEDIKYFHHAAGVCAMPLEERNKLVLLWVDSCLYIGKQALAENKYGFALAHFKLGLTCSKDYHYIFENLTAELETLLTSTETHFAAESKQATAIDDESDALKVNFPASFADYIQKYQLALTLTNNNSYPEAIAAAFQAVRINPDFPPAHYLLGRIHQLTGKIQEALSYYKTAHQLLPFNHIVLDNLLDCLPEADSFGEKFDAIRGRKLAAEDELREIEALENLMNEIVNFNTLAAAIDKEKTQFMKEYFDALRKLLKASNKHDPLALTILNNSETSEQNIILAAESHFLGKKALSLGKTDLALYYFEQAYFLNLHDVNAMMEIAKIHFLTNNNHTIPLTLYNHLIDTYHFTEAYLGRAALTKVQYQQLEANRQPQDKINLFKAHVTKDFTQFIIYATDVELSSVFRTQFFQHFLYAYLHDIADINKVIKNLSSAKIQSLITQKKAQAIEMTQQGNFVDAIKLYSEILKLEPNNETAYHLRGSVYFATRDYLRASIDYAMKAGLALLRHSPSLPADLSYLDQAKGSVAEFDFKDSSQAEAVFRLDFRSDYRRTRFVAGHPTTQVENDLIACKTNSIYLGVCAYGAGLIDEAIKLLKQDITNAPNDFISRTYLAACLATTTATHAKAFADLTNIINEFEYSIAYLERAKLNILHKQDALAAKEDLINFVRHASKHEKQQTTLITRQLCLMLGIDDAALKENSNSKVISEALTAANNYSEEKNHQAVITLLTPLLSQNLTCSALYYQLADAHAELRDFAHADLYDSLAIWFENEDKVNLYYYHRSLLRLQYGRLEAAITDFLYYQQLVAISDLRLNFWQSAPDLITKWAQACIVYGNELTKQGLYPRALAYFEAGVLYAPRAKAETLTLLDKRIAFVKNSLAQEKELVQKELLQEELTQVISLIDSVFEPLDTIITLSEEAKNAETARVAAENAARLQAEKLAKEQEKEEKKRKLDAEKALKKQIKAQQLAEKEALAAEKKRLKEIEAKKAAEEAAAAQRIIDEENQVKREAAQKAREDKIAKDKEKKRLKKLAKVAAVASSSVTAESTVEPLVTENVAVPVTMPTTTAETPQASNTATPEPTEPPVAVTAEPSVDLSFPNHVKLGDHAYAILKNLDNRFNSKLKKHYTTYIMGDYVENSARLLLLQTLEQRYGSDSIHYKTIADQAAFQATLAKLHPQDKHLITPIFYFITDAPMATISAFFDDLTALNPYANKAANPSKALNDTSNVRAFYLGNTTYQFYHCNDLATLAENGKQGFPIPLLMQISKEGVGQAELIDLNSSAKQLYADNPTLADALKAASTHPLLKRDNAWFDRYRQTATAPTLHNLYAHFAVSLTLHKLQDKFETLTLQNIVDKCYDTFTNQALFIVENCKSTVDLKPIIQDWAQFQNVQLPKPIFAASQANPTLFGKTSPPRTVPANPVMNNLSPPMRVPLPPVTAAQYHAQQQAEAQQRLFLQAQAQQQLLQYQQQQQWNAYYQQQQYMSGTPPLVYNPGFYYTPQQIEQMQIQAQQQYTLGMNYEPNPKPY